MSDYFLFLCYMLAVKWHEAFSFLFSFDKELNQAHDKLQQEVDDKVN